MLKRFLCAVIGLPLMASVAHADDGIDQAISEVIKPIVDPIVGTIFYSVPLFGANIPLIVGWLVIAAVVFTFYFGFIQFRGFKHSIELVRGDYLDPNDAGEVTPFQALATALSGTVGLGNIAGVGVAVYLGGPGATFWMILAGLLGMASKFTECVLGVRYRNEYEDGTVSGGPMYYLSKGLSEDGKAALGKFLAIFFSICCIGGAIGALIQGFKRAAFSNEAGIGSASIAHSAVQTKHPVTEGYVALLEPFIDTVVICTMTSLVITITGSWVADNGVTGIALTAKAFEANFSGFGYILAVAAVLFAFSTMISWSYYGLKAWTYMFGEGKAKEIVFKVIFCVFVVIGSSMSLGPVIDFSDAMIFAMAIANIVGLYMLMPKVKALLADYREKLASGEIKKMK